MSGHDDGRDAGAEALERYEVAAAGLRATLDGLVAGWDVAPFAWPEAACSPLRDRIPRYPVYPVYPDVRAAEDSDRRAWLRDVKRRLGLVGQREVLHRCTVERDLFTDGESWCWSWSWSCRMHDAGGLGYATQAEAFADAFAHGSRDRRALADEILRQETGILSGSLVDIGGILYPAPSARRQPSAASPSALPPPP